jgi:hypothetical protein
MDEKTILNFAPWARSIETSVAQIHEVPNG